MSAGGKIYADFIKLEKNAKGLKAIEASTNITVVPAIGVLADVKTYLDIAIPEIEARLDAIETSLNLIVSDLKK